MVTLFKTSFILSALLATGSACLAQDKWVIGQSAPLTGGSSVARYDLETGDIETIDVGGTPIDLTVADDSVWVAVDE